MNYHDDFGRVKDTYRSNGGHSQATWACCGKESETDESGVYYDYSYDSLDRMDISTKEADHALVSSHVFDAAGRTLKTVTSSDGLSVTVSNAFDLAGRTILSVDNAGLVTTYSYAGGGRISTAVLPGGATNIT